MGVSNKVGVKEGDTGVKGRLRVKGGGKAVKVGVKPVRSASAGEGGSLLRWGYTTLHYTTLHYTTLHYPGNS